VEEDNSPTKPVRRVFDGLVRRGRLRGGIVRFAFGRLREAIAYERRGRETSNLALLHPLTE
jgi:hypothetical protein